MYGYVKGFMKKEAECIRQVENWAIYEPHHKLDNPLFNKERVKKDLPVVAPKMDELLRHIEELDTEDQKKHGKLFKHMIFSDLKAAGGAKAIGGALLSHGYQLVYNSSLEITKPEKKSTKNFAILCSTKIYNKDVGIRFRRKILEMFNQRPENIHGEELRFIVLDYGFKEGIDLFDIKYVHIMETPITKADEKQIIGRGTRFCGQKGLTFDKKNGWPLYVFTYKTMLPGDLIDNPAESMFDLFMQLSNIDATKITFAKELERKCIQSSVDFELNKNIHSYGQDKDSEFMQIIKEVEKVYAPEIVKIKQPKEIVEKAGVKLEKYGFFNCKNGCKGNVMVIPTELMLLVWYTYKTKVGVKDYILERKPRSFLCKELISNREFCEKLQAVWKNPNQYIFNHRTKLEERIQALDYKHKYIHEQKKDMMWFIKDMIDQLNLPPEPPKKMMSYPEMQAFMKLHYKKFVWPEVVMENKCLEDKDEKKEESDLNKILFTPTQLTLQEYFTPKSAYKGLLVWHSTGTGKTCSGISIATKTFEKEGYTILWVTRSTLRGDIWKNMFKQICSITLQEQEKKPDVQEAIKSPMKYVAKNWIEPITYKQFSNLLTGKNEYYKEMVKRNGEKDPLRKTLIIIDEAHKLLSHDLKPQEKPNFEVLQKKILESYEVSKEDSVRLLLMTATPYSEDPMQMVQLLNLMRPKNDQFVVKYEDFKKEYLREDGSFRSPISFLSKVSGYISYLNRETDIRQFAHPVLKTIPVSMSESKKDELQREMTRLEEEVQESLETITANEGEKAKAKEKLKLERKVLMERCKKIKDKEDKKKCKEEMKGKEEEFKQMLFSEANEVILENKEKVKVLKKQLQEKKNALMNYRESDPSQERVLLEKCFKQEHT